MRITARQTHQIIAGQKTEIRTLSNPQRAALELAAHNPLRRVHDNTPGKPPWPASPNTLRALIERGLIHHSRVRNRRGWWVDQWQITETGRQTLRPQPKTRADLPLYLSRAGSIKYRQLPNGRWTVDQAHSGEGDYTTDPRRSIDHDRAPGARTTTAVEVLVTPTDLQDFAAEAQQREHDRRVEQGRQLDTLTLEQRLEQVTVTARSTRRDITGSVRMIRFMLANDRRPAAERNIIRLETQLAQRAA